MVHPTRKLGTHMGTLLQVRPPRGNKAIRTQVRLKAGGVRRGRETDLLAALTAQAAATKYSYNKPQKKKHSKWLTIALPALILLIIAGAVLGGVFGSRAAKNSKGSTGNTAGTTAVSDPAQVDAANQAAINGNADKLFSGSTDSYGNPLFLSSADTSAPSGNGQEAAACPDSNANGLSLTNLRPHPRVMAPGYMWDCMADRISKDAYLTMMNESVFQNATAFYAMPVTNYSIDGGYDGSGILDVSREIQQRVRAWAYAYRMTKDQKWLNRTWTELHTAAGNTSTPFGQGPAPLPDQHWNPGHFLDVAEMTAAFAIAYDWMYDGWTDNQKRAIRWSIIDLGLTPGLSALTDSNVGWWTQPANGNGNWNCVCNSGLILGALAISGDDGDDPANTASGVLSRAITNIQSNCFNGPYNDGTWAETPNYWYFGTSAAARAASALVAATGSDQGMNPNFPETGTFHMYVSGVGGMFAYGDHGPNKFSTNANGLLFWGKQYMRPLYTLFQRDRADAMGDPLALFWYDASAKGAFWNGLALDKWFSDPRGSWMSMRSSWTNFNGMYVAMKASNLTGHQTHGDLDVGDFVLDAMGTRWAGEYGSAQYLSTNYFSNETQDSERWEYYRKGTQGQNTIVIDEKNQLITYDPTNQQTFGTTNVTQSADLNFTPGTNDVAYFVTDMSTAYGAQTGQVKRGIRYLNGRRQVLLQDEIANGVAQSSIEWRVQTNASVSISGNTATLTINKIVDPNAAIGPLNINIPERTLKIQILSPSGATFNQTSANNRLYGTDPDTGVPVGDPSNDGVTVLSIPLQPGQQTIQTWWQPQWDDLSAADSASPKSVGLDQWSLTSHN